MYTFRCLAACFRCCSAHIRTGERDLGEERGRACVVKGWGEVPPVWGGGGTQSGKGLQCIYPQRAAANQRKGGCQIINTLLIKAVKLTKIDSMIDKMIMLGKISGNVLEEVFW